jgi:DMSO reductase family type II enzyme heme b subunit
MSLGESPKYATLVTVAATKDAIPDDPAADFWKKLAPSAIPLMGQVIVDTRNFNPSIDLVLVRGAWNDKEIAFHLTWDDPSESKTADQAKKLFVDAFSLQFPPKITAGPDRPYFLMGDDSDAVYLLRWEQGKGVAEASANGPAKIRAMEGSEAAGKVVYKDGRYQLVMKRALVGKGDRPTFQPGVFTPVAFQAWDGGEGESGTKMSLTSWYYLRLEEPQSSRRFVVPPVVAILTLAAMLLVIRAANRRR